MTVIVADRIGRHPCDELPIPRSLHGWRWWFRDPSATY
jgi:hypothetical protein